MRKIMNKIVAYTCVASMVFAGFAGYSVKADTDVTEEVTEVSLQLAQDGVDKVGPQEVPAGYAYQGGFAIPDTVTSDFTVLEITYVGDLSTIRFGSESGTTWFAENAEGTFKTVDGSDIVLNAETETTVAIDLVKSGVQFKAGEFVHVHAGGAEAFTYEFKSVKLKKGDAQEETKKEDILLQLAQDGVEKVGPQEVPAGYAYQGGFAIPDTVTSEYTILEITYVGDLSTIRFGSEAGTTWFAENAEGTFKSVDGSDIVLNAEAETTVEIDLAKTGVLFKAGEFVHVHAGGAEAFTYEFKSVKLKVGEKAVEESSVDESTSEEEIETSGQGREDDIILNGDENGQSSMIKNFPTVKAAYKYLGFATLKEPTAEYKYLILTYAGDITSIRFEFSFVNENGDDVEKAGPYWFNPEGQEMFFVTADGSEIPLDGGKGTTVVIDLEKSGIDISKFNSVHMHAGYGSEAKVFDFRIGMARLSKSAEVSGDDTIKPVEPTTKKTPATTKAQEVKKPAKVVVKKATKKKSAKSVKVSFKKVNGAKGYEVAVYKTKKDAKKNKKAVKTLKSVKKVSVKVSSKKLKKCKKLFVKVRAFTADAKGVKVYGDWSKIKTVKMTKK